MSEPKPKDKSFEISKWVVWDAYQRVKANDGAAGVDGESIEEFERDLKGNLGYAERRIMPSRWRIAACSPLPDPRAGVKYSA